MFPPFLLAVAFFVALAACGFGLVVAAVRLCRPDETRRRRWLRYGLRALGWVLIVFGALMLFVMLSLLWIALAIIAVMAVVKRRTGRQYVLLSTLAVAAERQMPLVRAIDAFALENGGILGQSARQAAKLIRAGCPLPDALEQVGGLVPRETLATIRVGYETGSLATALREVVDLQQSFEPIWTNMAGKLLYFCFLIALKTSIVIFMLLRIAPEFEKIFADFDASLPGVTQWVMEASGFVAAYWYLFFLALQPAIVILLLYTIARYIGWSGFDLPGTGPMVRRFHALPILHTLALAADRGAPFRDGIAALTKGYPRASVRKRLLRVGVDMAAGADWAESLAAHGLIRQADRAVLKAAERVGNLPWALREMAASSRRRLLYRLQGLVQVGFVLVLIAFGLMVLTFVVAFFMPLVQLIQNMSD